MQEAATIPPENSQLRRRTNHWNWICLLAAIGLHSAIVFPLMNAPTNPMDEGMVLVYPELLSKGMIPQRDFASAYPPGNIWFLAGAYRLLGTDIYAERTIGLLYQVLLLSGIFFLFRSRGLGVAMAGCILPALVIIMMGNVAFAWTGALAMGVWSLAVLTQPGDPRTRGIWAGTLAGLAVTWRADIAPALILGIGSYCIVAKWRRRDVYWLILAGSITLIPLMIHALIVKPSVFYDNLFYLPVIRSHNVRKLPLNYSNAYAGQLYALIVTSVVSALAVGWKVRGDAEHQGTALFAAGLFMVGVLPQGWQRADAMHLSFVAVLSLPMLVWTVSFLSRNRFMPLFVLCASAMALPQAAEYIYTSHSGNLSSYWVTNGDRMIASSSLPEQRIVDVLKANAKPNQSLFVGTKDLRFTFANDVAIYHLFPLLRPATYYIEFNPSWANRPNSGLAGDLAKADWAVLDSSWDHDIEPNGSNIPGSNAPNEVIQKRFKLVYSAEPFELYRRIAD